jgi:DNA gyrase subunit A
MAFKPEEKIAQVLSIKDYTISPYLVLATRNGLIKKTPLIEYDSPRTGGLIAISLKPGDEVVSASLDKLRGRTFASFNQSNVTAVYSR